MNQKTGANGRNRTDDLRFTKPLLYQLSYVGEICVRHYATFAPPRKQIGAAMPSSMTRLVVCATVVAIVFGWFLADFFAVWIL